MNEGERQKTWAYIYNQYNVIFHMKIPHLRTCLHVYFLLIIQASGNNSFSDRPGADRRRRDVSTSSEKAAPRTKHPSLKNFKDVNSVDIPSHASRFHSSYGRAGKKAQTMKKRPSDITISEHSVSAQPKHQTVRQRKVRPVSIADSGYSRSEVKGTTDLKLISFF